MAISHRLAALVYISLLLIIFMPLAGTITGLSITSFRTEISYNYVGWFILFAILAIGSLFAFIRFKKVDFKKGKSFVKSLYKPKSIKQELIDYIEYKLSVGENRLSIRESLLSVGWNKQLVNEAFREAEYPTTKKRKD